MSHEDDDLFDPPGHTGLEHVTVRELHPKDLDAVVRVDARVTGHARPEYFQKKLEEALRDSGVRISLAGEIEGMFAGFMLGRLYYGEFGLPEPVAIIDTIGVDPDFRGKRVGTAMFDQLQRNMKALGIETIQTQVDWKYQQLIGFLGRLGFTPAPALCLEKTIAES